MKGSQSSASTNNNITVLFASIKSNTSGCEPTTGSQEPFHTTNAKKVNKNSQNQFQSHVRTMFSPLFFAHVYPLVLS